MKIVTFQGGLGNQLFQYEFYLWLSAVNNNEKIYAYYPKKGLKHHNGLEIESCFEVKLPSSNFLATTTAILIKLLCKLKKTNRWLADTRHFSLNAVLFEDYWHDLKFSVNTNLKFIIPLDYWDKNPEIYKIFQTENTVSIHIRRGDYISEQNSLIYGNICTAEYYRTAIDVINKKIDHPCYLIFSDDVAWVKANMKIDNAYIIDVNKNKFNYLDMFLMSRCNHNIIANSTFSWWGAFINQNPDKIVVTPAKWFNSKYEEPQIFPSNWIKI